MEQFTILLALQNTVGWVTAVGVIAVLIVLYILFSTSHKKEDKEVAKAKVYKVRRKYFWGLTAVMAIGFLSSMAFLPYGNQDDKTDVTYSVLAFQWGWKIAEGDKLLTESVDEFRGANKIDVIPGQFVKFIVGTKDVTHSFGIYNEAGDMVAQVQAMPGYTNDLYYHFTEPGVYKVLCMEYCGIAHAMMIATINVQGPLNDVEETKVETPSEELSEENEEFKIDVVEAENNDLQGQL